LGQSWAQPIRTKIAIKIGATVEQRDVLVISGGYDAAQDDTVTRSTDSMGAAIYIVDALTGEKLWSADDSTFADMDYSIPATMSVADTNGDSLADLMVIGDMGGQVWRFDIHAGQPAATLVTGGVIADLGGDAADSNRRFYHSPSLFIGESSGYKWLGITIGSGYRAHPLSQDADDRFYMIKQADVYSAPLSYSKLTTTDLYDATDNDVGEEVSGAQAALDAKSGWYINFSNNGEKVLSKPLVFQNEIFFNTYEPKASGDACIVTAGTNRSYGVNTADGSPLADGDDAGSDITETDRSKLISSASFIDSQSLIILEGEDNSDDDDTPDGTATIGRMEGTGISDTGASIDDLIDKTFWYEE
jgi:type IV pilus assembly protein PilY1